MFCWQSLRCDRIRPDREERVMKHATRLFLAAFSGFWTAAWEASE
jgi:hypothetical protein